MFLIVWFLCASFTASYMILSPTAEKSRHRLVNFSGGKVYSFVNFILSVLCFWFLILPALLVGDILLLLTLVRNRRRRKVVNQQVVLHQLLLKSHVSGMTYTARKLFQELDSETRKAMLILLVKNDTELDEEVKLKLEEYLETFHNYESNN